MFGSLWLADRTGIGYNRALMGGHAMVLPKTYHIDSKRHLIVGVNKSSLLKRIKEKAFTEIEYRRQRYWRLFIDDNLEMIWIQR